MKYFVLEFGNKLVHYLEYKFPCLPKSVFSLERKIFLNHLQYDCKQLAREYPYAYRFSFFAKTAREARAREFHFRKEKLYLNYTSSLSYSLV